MQQSDDGVFYIPVLVNPSMEVAYQNKLKKRSSNKSVPFSVEEMEQKARGSKCVTYITHFNDIIAMFDEAHNLNFKSEQDPPVSDPKVTGIQKTNFWGR